MDLSQVFAGGELLFGLVMAVVGAWQYVLGQPLPGVLGRSIRPGQTAGGLPAVRWQLSGAAQGFFGLGFVMYGAAVFLEGHMDGGGLGAIRTVALVTWVIAAGIAVLLFTRYRRRT